MEFALSVLHGLITPGRPMVPRGFLFQGDRAAGNGEELRILLLVVFGSLGTLARYALEGAVQYLAGSAFPFGTLAVNLIGCFLLGGVGQYAIHHISVPPEWRMGVTVGLFGAFTTFSTFSWESVHMLDDGDWIKAAIYIGASLLGGLMLLRAGMILADRL
jgi:CrcB protein